MSEILTRHFYDWFEYEAWALYESEPIVSRMTAHPNLDCTREQLVRDHVAWYRQIVGEDALPDLPSDLGDATQFVLAAWSELIREADPEARVHATDDMPVADVAMHLLTQSAFHRGLWCSYAEDMGLKFPDTSLAAWRRSLKLPQTTNPSTRTIRVDG